MGVAGFIMPGDLRIVFSGFGFAGARGVSGITALLLDGDLVNTAAKACKCKFRRSIAPRNSLAHTLLLFFTVQHNS